MIEKLDLEDCKNTKKIKIGELTPEIIKLLNLNDKPRNINMWTDRIEHCEKHKKDFSSEQDFLISLESIPEIINSPDYVGLHPDGKSIQYIKKITENCLVGITTKSMLFRSMYPIPDNKLNNYINSNRIFKVKKEE